MPEGFTVINETAPAEHEDVARERIAAKALLHQQRQAIHTFPHVCVATGNPDPDTCRDRDHRRSRMASTRASAAESTMTRRSYTISITKWPLVGAADGIGSATTIAGTKRDLCPEAPSGPVQNDRRQFSKSEREMPYRRAVDEIARGVTALNLTRQDPPSAFITFVFAARPFATQCEQFYTVVTVAFKPWVNIGSSYAMNSMKHCAMKLPVRLWRLRRIADRHSILADQGTR
jgi:hypothetical protein